MVFLHRLQKLRYRQGLCVLIVGLLECALSMVSVWMSPSLPLLLSEETPLDAPLTKSEESWLVSAEKLGAIFGCTIAALSADFIGRKLKLLLSAIPFIVTMSIAAFTKSASVLIVLRVIGGLGTGVIFAVSPIYVAEVSDKDIRGGLGIVRMIIGMLGTVYVYSVGPFISYVALTLTCAIFPLIFIILFLFMPETPYYLVKKGNLNAARKSIKQLSEDDITNQAIQSKIQEIQHFVDQDIKNKGGLKELIFIRANRYALFITLVLRSILVFSGIFVILSYVQYLIEESGSSLSPEISSIIFGVITIPSTLVSALLIDKLGRRPLFIISSFGCSVALIAEGVYFYLKENGDVTGIRWLPTTGLCLFIVTVGLGVTGIPGVVQVEMFSLNVKSIASSIIMIYGSAASFVLLKFFQPLSDSLGMYAMFWFFAGVCIFGCLFALFILPETKGKTFYEIQESLYKRKKTEEII